MLRVANYRCGIILFGFFVRSFLILTFFLYYSHAYAHDLWSNGKTVPEWVKKSCCGLKTYTTYDLIKSTTWATTTQ